ncbi:hypothetical protein BD779DRAFT_1520320 [Infundibulicybe gibba]|nr:hypothetical protein BD779DRAFT_1520320 [Infundibulicybe gibba]
MAVTRPTVMATPNIRYTTLFITYVSSLPPATAAHSALSNPEASSECVCGSMNMRKKTMSLRTTASAEAERMHRSSVTFRIQRSVTILFRILPRPSFQLLPSWFYYMHAHHRWAGAPLSKALAGIVYLLGTFSMYTLRKNHCGQPVSTVVWLWITREGGSPQNNRFGS